jgi:hypothetical protein
MTLDIEMILRRATVASVQKYMLPFKENEVTFKSPKLVVEKVLTTA